MPVRAVVGDHRSAGGYQIRGHLKDGRPRRVAEAKYVSKTGGDGYPGSALDVGGWEGIYGTQALSFANQWRWTGVPVLLTDETLMVMVIGKLVMRKITPVAIHVLTISAVRKMESRNLLTLIFPKGLVPTI